MRIEPTSPLLALAFLPLLTAPALAGQDVVIFQDVPTVDELNGVLFGKRGEAAHGEAAQGETKPIALKTRSIRFRDQATPAAPLPEAPAAPAPAAVAVQESLPAPTPEPVQTASLGEAPAPAPGGGVALGFNILFRLNSTEMLPESKPYVDRLGEVLSLPENEGKSLVVVGHTDASGDEAYNQHLSEARAQAVRAYLADAWHVPIANLDVKGVGEGSPLPGTDPLDATNRRVEFYALN
ncbi:MAG: OmpA family protein [Geminicoccaceae bacterium]|nr:OmpA family protein [Geminicoccaceae bacterium]